MNDYQAIKDLVDSLQDSHERTKHKLGLAMQTLEYVGLNKQLNQEDGMQRCLDALTIIRSVK